MAEGGLTPQSDEASLAIIQPQEPHPVHRGLAQHAAIEACEFPVDDPFGALAPERKAAIANDGVLVHLRRVCMRNSNCDVKCVLPEGWSVRNAAGKVCVVLGNRDYVAVVDEELMQFCVFYAPGPLL